MDDQGFLASCPPPHLLNIVCALAARYSQVYGMQPILGSADAGSPREIWASKAKGQVARNLAVASIEMVQTLLLISWYEFSQDRDGVRCPHGTRYRSLMKAGSMDVSFPTGIVRGLIQFKGIQAWRCEWVRTLVRRSMPSQILPTDIFPGLDTFENQTPSSDNPDQDAHQSLRCALFMMDAIMSIGSRYTFGFLQKEADMTRIAGRAGMYKTSLDQVPSLPPLTTPSGHTLTNPYPYMTRIFCLADRVTRILVDKCTTTIDEVALEQAQSQLNEFSTSLPVDLRFETFTFQKYASIAQGGAFVLLNVSHFSVLVTQLIWIAVMVPHVRTASSVPSLFWLTLTD